MINNIMDTATYRLLTIYYIQTEQWDMIQPYLRLNEDVDMGPWLARELLTLNPYTEQIAQTLDRVIGKVPPEERTQQLILYEARLPSIQYYLERENIPTQVVQPCLYKYPQWTPSLLHYVLIRDTVDRMERLEVIFAHGADPNEQEEQHGCSALMTYLSRACHESIMTGQNTLRMDIVHYLLEKGADPLLENKDGLHSIQWVEREISRNRRNNRGATQRNLELLEEVHMLLRRYM